jgi:hypothetical protein
VKAHLRGASGQESFEPDPRWGIAGNHAIVEVLSLTKLEKPDTVRRLSVARDRGVLRIPNATVMYDSGHSPTIPNQSSLGMLERGLPFTF